MFHDNLQDEVRSSSIEDSTQKAEVVDAHADSHEMVHVVPIYKLSKLCVVLVDRVYDIFMCTVSRYPECLVTNVLSKLMMYHAQT